MNRHFRMIALVVFLLVSFTTITKYSARELAPRQEEALGVKSKGVGSQESVSKIKGFDSFDKLMGLEENSSCEGGLYEEDGLRRRDMLEAHLDYIYTQQHKP
ncbi:phytosulfokines 6 [Dorcoceras hygrometricum]|uniref:Phytosulfokine n=1 Tax=Dorcoceras hygrometricum TaxID=472368 RepID=A0A2Z7CJ94_9LAMI|nr:phytosulfokines 6 [Dorcoceras hygrometricum]